MSATAVIHDFAPPRSCPELSSIMEAVRAMVPTLRAEARDTERNRRVSARIFAMLSEADVFKVARPAAFGGFEYGISDLAPIAFELGRGCGSTAWCASLECGYNWMVSFFPLEAQAEVWDDPDAHFTASYQPSRSVEAVPDGIRVAGAWPFASGCDNATWAILAVLVPQPAGAPDLAWALVPMADIRIDGNSWNTSGLQGSSSKTLHIGTPVFVPLHRLVRFADVLTGNAPGRSIPGNVMSLCGFMPFSATNLVAPILGMACGAVDVFTEAARSRVRTRRRLRHRRTDRRQPGLGRERQHGCLQVQFGCAGRGVPRRRHTQRRHGHRRPARTAVHAHG